MIQREINRAERHVAHLHQLHHDEPEPSSSSDDDEESESSFSEGSIPPRIQEAILNHAEISDRIVTSVVKNLVVILSNIL